MKVLIINGPNLNLLGVRQPEIYGDRAMDVILGDVSDLCELQFFQSNHEGDIIDKIQEVGFDESYAGIVLNAGAYTHTSYAIADAIASIKISVIEVHVSNVQSREEFRHKSVIAPQCIGVIAGFGLNSYKLAVLALLDEC